MQRTTALLAALLLTAAPALADDFVTLDAEGSVTETADRFVAAVETAGATVFARVPHSQGAESVGMELQDAELVIFGNPELGTPALQEDIRAGLVLPLRVLVYDDEGQTRITYEDVDEMFDELDIDDDAEFVAKMKGALETLTTTAAGG